ncbi:hypothetical protein MKZ38_000917 [Zalerion maritima]|uniref:BZIP domain-containing protein n=1 Tax=Zalerion maritima TaxID=339359 RepID=A0AAD5WML9_9PEZI|nr:hypothetical protein MKZ38_000917 [Zalerion maritima]
MAMFSKTKSPPSTPPPPSKDGNKTQGASGSGVGSILPEQAAKEKAQARRAQVRKAQIQHRQRKAYYVKQLELDIVHIREMIAEAEKESKHLRNENASIRQKLTVATNPSPNTTAPPGHPMQQHSTSPAGTGFLSVGGSASGSAGASPVFTPGGSMQLPPSATTTSFFSDPGLDDLSFSLQMDEAMNYPCFRYTRSGSSPDSGGGMGGWGGSSGGVPSPPQAPAAGSPPQHQHQQSSEGGAVVPGIDLNPEQTDLAINFILALEHICWGHFHARDFEPDANPSGRASAHTLMASTIALASAPPQVFKQLGKSQRNVWFTPSALQSNPISGEISWQASQGGGRGLSLQSLYGLATSLNPGDKEITPVQAWFELAQSFDIDIILNPVVIDGLKRELHGVVKCLHYGAIMERAAFESVVGRVIGEFLGVTGSNMDIPALPELGSPGLPPEGGDGSSSFGGDFQQLLQQRPGLAVAGPNPSGGTI